MLTVWSLVVVRLSAECQLVRHVGRRAAVPLGERPEGVALGARCLGDDTVTGVNLLLAAVAAGHQRH